ncbi:MAG: thioredoxin family protein [Chloroflexota bacterium]
MTQQKESVVTPERFNSGLTWDQWMKHIERNVPKFQYNYDETTIPADFEKRLKAIAARPNAPKKMLVIGEDWCPDVFRGLPVVVKIADALGAETRIFPRDENLDIMKEYLNHGEHMSIPAVVFYTADHEEIAAWLERPKKAQDELHNIGQLFEGLDKEKDAAEMRSRYNAFQEGPMWASWRDETIVEVTDLLEAKVS